MCVLSALRLALYIQHFLYVYIEGIVNVHCVCIQSRTFCMCTLSALHLALNIQHFLYEYIECTTIVRGVSDVRYKCGMSHMHTSHVHGVHYHCAWSVHSVSHFLYVYIECIVNMHGVCIESGTFCVCVYVCMHVCVCMYACVKYALRLTLNIQRFLYVYIEGIVKVH